MYNETENQTRLRRAHEALMSARSNENEARFALASATEATRRAKEKYDALFIEEERQEFERRKQEGSRPYDATNYPPRGGFDGTHYTHHDGNVFRLQTGCGYDCWRCAFDRANDSGTCNTSASKYCALGHFTRVDGAYVKMRRLLWEVLRNVGPPPANGVQAPAPCVTLISAPAVGGGLKEEEL